MNILLDKFKEILLAVLPVSVIVLILGFTVLSIDLTQVARFSLGALFIVLGLSIFLFGVDIGITPIGNLLGAYLIKTNKLAMVIGGGILLGFVVAIAEPDLHILAGQVHTVTAGLLPKSTLVIVVSVGIGLLLAFGFTRIAYGIPIHVALTVIYGLVLLMGLFLSPEMLAISFDAAGAVTGVLLVPFVLALATGISAFRRDSRASEEDSFGLLGITATGTVITVMLMSILSKAGGITEDVTGKLDMSHSDQIITPFMKVAPLITAEALAALFPLLVILLVFKRFSFQLSKRVFRTILKGMAYTFIGLVLFLIGANAGFMEIGAAVGYQLASLDNKFIVVIMGFIIGFVSMLAEPSVHILTHQIEDVTSGYIQRKLVLGAICIGVGMAVALFILKILIPGIKLSHYLFFGYMACIVLSYFVPRLFVGIAFDSGTVSSGPMTATFILAFTQGIAEAVEGANVLIDGFGAVAIVTMTPVITLQILGMIFKIKTRKRDVK
ncbi:MAG: DUF1538 domain-containing protein [Smithellaceae bacterium]|nr:DUF1538 domain-containing protein [Smithellaceae bacterium]